MSNIEMSNEEYQALIEEMKKDKNSTRQRMFWAPPSDKEGTFKIRFLPPIKKNNEKMFYFKHRVHWINGKSYECVKQTLIDKNGNPHEAEECPVCKFVSKLYETAEKDSEEYKLAGNLAAKDRYIYRIVVRGNEDETKPEFFESGKKLFETLFHILTESDFGNIIDLKNGRDFNLVKVGTGRRAKYDSSSPSANTSVVFSSKEKIAEFLTKLEEMPKFNSFIDFVSADILKSVLKKYLSGDSEEDDMLKAAASKPIESKEEEVKTSMPKVAKVKEEVVEAKEEDEVDKLLAEFNF